MATSVRAVWVLVVLTAATSASADTLGGNKSAVCSDLAAEPARVSFDPGALADSRSACISATDAVTLRTVADSDAAAAGLYIRRRWDVFGLELEAGARVAQLLVAEGMDLGSDSFEFGPIVLGAAGGESVKWFGLDGRWSAQLKLEIPRSNSELEHVAVFASPALTWTAALKSSVNLHSRVALIVFNQPITQTVVTRSSAAGSVDVSARVSKLISVAGGLEAQTRLDDAAFDHLLPRAAIRFGQKTQAAVSVGVPVVGDQPADVVVTLGVVRHR